MIACIALSFALAFSPPRTMSDVLDPQNKNAQSIIQATKELKVDQKKGLYFLLLNMPQNDLEHLNANVLRTHIQLAYRAMSEVSWRKRVPEEIFLNYVLPYANLDETREDWRTSLYKRYISLAKSCKTPGEAAQKLNEKIFADLNVRYHATKRPKPNQSPSESIKASYASCTGLSILLVDACRAVGVPARIAGTAMWFDDSGNHTWVEVWDDGEWKYIGAAEPGPFNKTWFSDRASKADPSNPRYAIYAVSFGRTSENFVLSWDRDNTEIAAVNVTYRYKGEKETLLAIEPKPTESKLLEGTLVLDRHSLASTDSKARAVLDTMRSKLTEITGISGLFQAAKDGKYAARLEVRPNMTSLGKEGYELTITPDLVTFAAPTETGLKRAFQAFMQLVPKNAKELGVVKVPCAKVRDIR